MDKKSIIKITAGIVIFLIMLSVLLTYIGKIMIPFDHFVDHQQRM